MSPAAQSLFSLRLPAWRSRLLLMGLLAWFVVLAGRALYLQGKSTRLNSSHRL